MSASKVYLDTNIFKFSATNLPRFQPRLQNINWGEVNNQVTVHDYVSVNPNEKITNTKLKQNAELLVELADLGKQGKIKYLIQNETLFETWFLPDMDSRSGKFYGSPITHVEAPINYSRTMIGGNINDKDMQFDFLKSIKHKRFIELQKITGAYQGKNKMNRNQLLDAFHIWCAEHNECDYFLTMDFKLIKMISDNKKQNIKVKLITPSDLLIKIKSGTCGYIWSYLNIWLGQYSKKNNDKIKP
jgi:hypothetical protein